ncbi:hypothetical protein HHK36_007697 [Tetracentron sinense]|uniref:SET domain-containing protein n=1 Tax=Tetracentron sinense TaxID=13715 RepID=A0A835DM10_TETSI|nr:hypothetical protein HHK36_007697 [Tetracentron sinense]
MSEKTASLVKTAEIEGKGRGMVATQQVKAGQIVLIDSPILLYSAIPMKNGIYSNYCSNCFRKLNTPVPSPVVSCPSCSYHAPFCSPNCRSVALSSSHSHWVCGALNYMRQSQSQLSLDNERQVQAYFLIAAYNLAVVSPSNFQQLLSLEGESPSTPPDAATLMIHSFIAFLSPPRSFAGFSLELTTALLAKDKVNAFGLMEPFSESVDRTVRAYGIYPKASFFNHDCLPNACRFDYVDSAAERNTDIVVKVLHDVPEGREICLSYFPVDENYADRQKRLLEDYGFTCECDRCKVEMNWPDEDQDENENDESMEEDGIENEDDFPHAYFFFRYMCDGNNCSGTLAPLPPSEEGTPSKVMECNVCGQLKADKSFCGNGDGGEDGVVLD